MLKPLKTKQKGFTIIEVLIVLAIAGLIMVIVFMAVPALQRNAHNQQYKTEANNLMAAYQEISNNAGGGALQQSNAASVLSAANTKTVTVLNITSVTSSPVGSTVNPAPSLSTPTTDTIVTGAKCSAQNSLTVGSGSNRDYAIFFYLEAPNNQTTPQCVDA